MKDKITKQLSYILTVAFLTMLFLNLFGLADISYWIVFSPLWGGIVLFFVLLIVGIIIGAGAYHYRKFKAKYNKDQES